MKTITSAIVAAVVALGLPASAQAKLPSLHSGKYESLMLAISPDDRVDGYFSEQSGDAFHCSFYLKGKIGPAGLIQVQTWADSQPLRPGVIDLTGGSVTLVIPGAREYAGCANVLMPEIETGIEYTQTRKADWIGLVTISAEKALLQATPEAKAKHKAYVVKGDVVGILGYQDGWAQVEFISDQDRSFKGWINQAQYRAIEAPR